MKPILRRSAIGSAFALLTTLTARAETSQPQFELAPEEVEAVAFELQTAPVRADPLAAAGTSPSTLPTSPEGITLEGLVAIALERSPRLAVQRAKVGEAIANAQGAGLLPNPEIRAGSKKVSGDGTGPVLGVNQELPINGVLGLERRAAGFEYSAEQARLAREVQVVLADVERAYVAVLAAARMAEVDAQGLETASGSLQLVSDTFRAGLVSSLPLGLARSERANAKRTLDLSERQLLFERQALASLLGISEPQLPVVSGDLNSSLLPSSEEATDAQRPDLRAASFDLQAAQTSAQAAQRARLPNPVIGYEREEADDETENFFTIGLEIPILNSGKAKVQQSLAERQTAAMQKKAAEQTVAIEIEQASTRLVAAQEAARIYETEIRPANQEAIVAAQGAFASGTTDLSLLLSTQSQLVENERGYVQALKELREAEIAYRLALGSAKY